MLLVEWHWRQITEVTWRESCLSATWSITNLTNSGLLLNPVVRSGKALLMTGLVIKLQDPPTIIHKNWNQQYYPMYR